jgi:RNA recognition motif-containing protein
MSLFVGRLNDRVSKRDLEDAFGHYGRLVRCDVKSTFAFVTFEDERDAEDAVSELHGREIAGCRINVEWTKESGRGRGKDDLCYECGKPGSSSLVMCS